jgi:hypothetical protein
MIHLPQAKSFVVFVMQVAPSSKEFRATKACDFLSLTSEAKHSFLCLCCNAQYFRSSQHFSALFWHDGDKRYSCRYLHPLHFLLVHHRDHSLGFGLLDLRPQHRTSSVCGQSLSKGSRDMS